MIRPGYEEAADGDGSNVAALFDDEEFNEEYDYFFLMEADVMPIRKHWVDRLLMLAMSGKAGVVDFWMMGSLTVADIAVEDVDTVININALFKLKEARFRELIRAARVGRVEGPPD